MRLSGTEMFFFSISSNLYEVSSKSFAFSLQPYKAISMPEHMIFNLLILLEYISIYGNYSMTV